jgi:signal transduction histidine kinase
MDPLHVRLELLGWLRAVEIGLVRAEAARAAAGELVRGRTHELGNQVQILRLASIELERRATSEQAELIADLRAAGEAANTVLADLLATARVPERAMVGDPVADVVRRAVERARPAFAHPLDLRIDLGDDVRTRATADELSAAVIAALLDATDPVPWYLNGTEARAAAAASRIRLWVRQRTVEKKPIVEVLVIVDRPYMAVAMLLEPPGPLYVVRLAAQAAGGEASISEGREGVELAIELPVVQSSSSS